jgi:hypothetical protein
MSDVYPGFCGSDGFLPVLGQPAASPQPCECALHDRATRQELEAFGFVRPLDDLQGERADLLHRALKLRSGIAAVGEDVSQPRPAFENGPEGSRCAVPVLDIGGVDDETDHQADGVDNDVTLAPVDLLSRVEVTNSAAFRCLDDWLSITPAVGLASRPSASRAAMTRPLLMVRNRPSSRQR